MDIQLTTFVRKPFYVGAIQVTPENMEILAKWAKGQIEQNPRSKSLYIKLDIPTAKHPRHEMAFAGDWIVKTGEIFRIYTDEGLKKAFLPAGQFGDDVAAYNRKQRRLENADLCEKHSLSIRIHECDGDSY